MTPEEYHEFISHLEYETGEFEEALAASRVPFEKMIGGWRKRILSEAGERWPKLTKDELQRLTAKYFG